MEIGSILHKALELKGRMIMEGTSLADNQELPLESVNKVP